MTIKEILKHYEEGSMTTRQIVDGYLEKIHAEDADIGAFVEVFEADARLQADEIDSKRKSGADLGPLAGVPIAIKDNMLLQGKISSGGSRILENYKASYSATVVERLIEAGAIIIGRTNMDEFASGSSTETSQFGVTKNPIDKERIPGGSSGGSAAAVAAGFVPVALGSDTGGSIRQPASLCGVVGFKPTYGAVSRYGLMAMASSLDQIGPMAMNVDDVAEVLRVIGGHDIRDSTSHSEDIALPELAPKSMKGLKIGVPKQFFNDSLGHDLEKSVRDAIAAYVADGAEIVELDLPILESALAMYYVIMPAELSSNLNRYDGLQYGRVAPGDTISEQVKATRTQGFGDEIKRRILLGTFVLSAGYVDAYYKKAVSARQALREQLNEAFSKVDVLMGPTTPTVAWKLGEKFDDPLTMYLADIYTVVANLAGIPALSIPCGDVDGLPVGLQIMGPAGSDAKLLDLGHWYEQL
ncbi:Asp-tRNA(Asn)/Glu-tRNA(Gln) amidotransferase subunit GatA [Candidatus Uhrbacteria bacterium]|nr:Asp-tRNA(Asn)/Glu-tRNA(Gln) amidotransferase subunit GatA [Candidatus Uhrbacteria bacterium]